MKAVMSRDVSLQECPLKGGSTVLEKMDTLGFPARLT